MRAYFFGNFYLSSIQQGIQAAHVVGDMFVKSIDESSPAVRDLWDWAENHKTMILLNGGMASDLLSTECVFQSEANPYAWASFREEEAALNNSLTSVGIILPAKIYAGAAAMRSQGLTLNELSDAFGQLTFATNGVDEIHTYTRFDGLVMEHMNRCGLAK